MLMLYRRSQLHAILSNFYALMFFLIISVSSLISQITLYEKNYPKDLNYVFNNVIESQSRNFSDGDSGPNKIWNFKYLQSGNKDSFFISDEISLFPNTFVGSTTFDNIVDNEGLNSKSNLRFLKVNSDSVSYLGVLNLTDPKENFIFLDPLKLFVFPCTYLTTFNDNAKYVYENDTLESIFNFNVEGWGKLIMPTKTEYDVLKIKAIRIDSSSNYRQETTTYEWWSNKINVPLVTFSIIYYKTPFTSKTQSGVIFFDDSKYVGNDTPIKIENVKIFPNPTSDFIKIDFKDNILKSADVAVYDLIGRLLITTKYENPSSIISLNINNLAAGEYILKIQDDKKREVDIPFNKY
jgi:Secretion system C-terminal sorting domain